MYRDCKSKVGSKNSALGYVGEMVKNILNQKCMIQAFAILLFIQAFQFLILVVDTTTTETAKMFI